MSQIGIAIGIGRANGVGRKGKALAVGSNRHLRNNGHLARLTFLREADAMQSEELVGTTFSHEIDGMLARQTLYSGNGGAQSLRLED